LFADGAGCAEHKYHRCSSVGRCTEKCIRIIGRGLGEGAWRFAGRLVRYFFRMAETSSEILTLSPTNRLPLPSA